jgi:hypothetical protein
MRRIHFGLLAAALSMMVVSFALSGCGGSKSDDDDEGSAPRKKSKSAKGTSGGPKGSALKPVTAKEYGVIRGEVKWPGDKKPDFSSQTEALQKGMSTDKDYCLTGKKKDGSTGKHPIMDYETFQQTYRVGDNMGVGNVFVWIVPEQGYYFEVPDDQLAKFKNSEVLLSQPHCAFLPHASVLFPSHYKDGKQEPTGQKLMIENDAEVSHNSKVQGNPAVNPVRDRTLPPKDKEEYPVKADKSPITVSCGIHTWMKAYIRAFDHPYAAVTSVGGDLKAHKYEDPKSPKYGTYEITGVPVGAKVRIFAWHEDMEHLAGATGRELTIKKENVENFEAKPK